MVDKPPTADDPAGVTEVGPAEAATAADAEAALGVDATVAAEGTATEETEGTPAGPPAEALRTGAGVACTVCGT